MPDVPPKGVEILIEIDDRASARKRSICYRCGEPYHFASECFTFRTRMCSQWEKGACRNEHCTFAHGAHQLRPMYCESSVFSK